MFKYNGFGKKTNYSSIWLTASMVIFISKICPLKLVRLSIGFWLAVSTSCTPSSAIFSGWLRSPTSIMIRTAWWSEWPSPRTHSGTKRAVSYSRCVCEITLVCSIALSVMDLPYNFSGHGVSNTHKSQGAKIKNLRPGTLNSGLPCRLDF